MLGEGRVSNTSECLGFFVWLFFPDEHVKYIVYIFSLISFLMDLKSSKPLYPFVLPFYKNSLWKH